MRITSEQPSAKLQLLPKPLLSLTDEELMAYVVELRGSRGKTLEKKAKTPKNPSASPPGAKKKSSIIDMDDMDDIG